MSWRWENIASRDMGHNDKLKLEFEKIAFNSGELWRACLLIDT